MTTDAERLAEIRARWKANPHPYMDMQTDDVGFLLEAATSRPERVPERDLTEERMDCYQYGTVEMRPSAPAASEERIEAAVESTAAAIQTLPLFSARDRWIAETAARAALSAIGQGEDLRATLTVVLEMIQGSCSGGWLCDRLGLDAGNGITTAISNALEERCGCEDLRGELARVKNQRNLCRERREREMHQREDLRAENERLRWALEKIVATTVGKKNSGPGILATARAVLERKEGKS